MSEEALDMLYEAAIGTPWMANEHGLWCPACGHLFVTPWAITDDYEPPDNCRECGFPEDFEP